jgi:ornithine cyclodeaminase/alanine dehydrogenase-like protein (mu-crystallin family)
MGRTYNDQITIVDLTGVAVQDIQIAKAVYHGLKEIE